MRMCGMDNTTRNLNMAAETGAGLAFGLKSGVIVGAILFFASVLGAVVGFRMVPPAKGREIDDISTRLLCGLLSSCTLGFWSAYKYIQADPEWLAFWMRIFAGFDDQRLYALAGAGMPFVCLAALPGFWIVAGFMRFARNKAADLSGSGAKR
jgi:hypothetical protein